MTNIYSGLAHLNGNVLASLDIETTGRRPGFHDICQIAILPLDSDIRPLAGVRPFYTNIRPQYPERVEMGAMNVHGINLEQLLLHAPDCERVQDRLIEWFDRLGLPAGKCLVPLSQNWAFECKFLTTWLGPDLMDRIFHSHARDPMLLAIALNDMAAFSADELPFNRVGLGSLCNVLGVTNERPHDALADAAAAAEVYRALVTRRLV